MNIKTLIAALLDLLRNIIYLAAATAAVAVIAPNTPDPALVIVISTTLIALITVLATLSRRTADLIRVINALADLIHGRTRH